MCGKLCNIHQVHDFNAPMRSGVAWKKVINDAMDEWHKRVRGRVFSSK